MDQRDYPVHQEQRVRKDQRDCKALPELKVLKGVRGVPVRQDRLAPRVFPVQQDLLEPLVQRWLLMH
ncbi:MAG: hypothetical protein ABW092_19740 [Candidatus Thiodiazotropha sp.]